MILACFDLSNGSGKTVDMGMDLRSWDLQPSGSRNGFRVLYGFSVVAAILGVITFLVCTTIAIWNYEGYSLSKKFLSDLGSQEFRLSYLFNYSLIGLGFSLIPMFVMIWITDPRNSFAAKLTAIFGTISAIGLIGLGSCPIDRHFFAHNAWLGVWLFPMFYMTVSFFYVAARSPLVGIGFVGASLVMVVAMIVYLLNVELSTYELLQKAVVVCGLIWLGYMIAFMIQSGWKVLQNWEIDDDSKARKEASYMSTLKWRNHRAE